MPNCSPIVATYPEGHTDAKSGFGDCGDRGGLDRGTGGGTNVRSGLSGLPARVRTYECRYNSLAQCNASASGRSAQCVNNPYVADAGDEPLGPRYWHRRVY